MSQTIHAGAGYYRVRRPGDYLDPSTSTYWPGVVELLVTRTPRGWTWEISHLGRDERSLAKSALAWRTRRDALTEGKREFYRLAGPMTHRREVFAAWQSIPAATVAEDAKP